MARKTLGNKGVQLINGAIGRFQGIIDNLTNGINLCTEQSSQNNEEMDKISDQNADLQIKISEAQEFRDNLKNMVGHSQEK